MAAAPASQRAPPETVMLDELVAQYEPVPFDHKAHASMAQMWDGCTTCHQGQGSATSFEWASHTPNSVQQGDEWRIDGLAEAVRAGSREVPAATPHGEVRLGLELSRRERAILLAGGLVAYARGRP